MSVCLEAFSTSWPNDLFSPVEPRNTGTGFESWSDLVIVIEVVQKHCSKLFKSVDCSEWEIIARYIPNVDPILGRNKFGKHHEHSIE